MTTTHVTRIVTVFRQWNDVASWAGDPGLRQPGVAWILVNDAPGTPPHPAVLTLLERLGAQLITHRRNRGLSAARNTGWNAATGTWIDFIDGDDTPLPLHASLLPPPEDADVVACPVRHSRINASGAVEDTSGNRPAHGEAGLFRRLFLHDDPRVASLLFRRSLLEALDGYDARFDGAEDLELNHRAVRAGARVAHAAHAKQDYRELPNSSAKAARLATLRTFLQRFLVDTAPEHRDDLRAYLADAERLVFWAEAARFRAAEPWPHRLREAVKLLLPRRHG